MQPSTRASVFAELAPSVESSLPSRWRRPQRGDLLRRLSGRVGVASVGVVLLTALVGPLVAPHDPFAITGGSLVRPSPGHLMGTDALGRDVFSAILYGARTSLLVGGAVSLIALVLGTAVGMTAGYRGGWIDDALMRTTEFFQVVPRFFLAVIAIALLGPGLDRIVLALGLTSWPTLARVARGEVMAMRDLDFVRAAEALGAPASRIVRRQLLPNVMPNVMVALGLLFGQVLLLEATLGFLGLGDPGRISWGMLAAQSQGFLRVAWWLALFPGLAITVTVLGVNLLADAISATRVEW
ncbi:MAG: ABC transporter permease [Gemmatimonadota bacterium]|nr:ABC transporter permease [Gemmatimonadota bacterium]